MYPYYYPYDNSYLMPTFNSYFSDPNNLYQYYAYNQEIKIEENVYKAEEVNTNYSTNDNVNSHEPLPPKPSISQQNLNFTDAIPLKKSTHLKPSDAIKKTNRSKLDKIQTIQLLPKLRYTHKNFESNIINKIFSFLWSQSKSKGLVCKILKNRTKQALYFDYMRIIRKYCKRYINKEYLLNLCDYKMEHIAYKIVIKQTQKLKYFTMDQLSKTIRQLIYIYLDTVCITSILTSKKMRMDIWKEHFQKMRNIREYLFAGLSAEQYEQKMLCSYSQPSQYEQEVPSQIK